MVNWISKSIKEKIIYVYQNPKKDFYTEPIRKALRLAVSDSHHIYTLG